MLLPPHYIIFFIDKQVLRFFAITFNNLPFIFSDYNKFLNIQLILWTYLYYVMDVHGDCCLTIFRSWQTVYYYFRRWQREGVWKQIHDYLRAEIRVRAGRNIQPSAGIVDCQSIATGNHGVEKGFDGGKLIKGRFRHIVVDVMGLLLAVIVHSAGIQERRGLKFLLFKIRHQFPLLKLIWADGGYDGQPLQVWMQRWFKWVIEVVKRNQDTKGFEVLPRRWVVERTFAWFGRYRRLSKDYEYLPSSSETMLYVAMINLMLRRLTRKNKISYSIRF